MRILGFLRRRAKVLEEGVPPPGLTWEDLEEVEEEMAREGLPEQEREELGPLLADWARAHGYGSVFEIVASEEVWYDLPEDARRKIVEALRRGRLREPLPAPKSTREFLEEALACAGYSDGRSARILYLEWLVRADEIERRKRGGGSWRLGEPPQAATLADLLAFLVERDAIPGYERERVERLAACLPAPPPERIFFTPPTRVFWRTLEEARKGFAVWSDGRWWYFTLLAPAFYAGEVQHTARRLVEEVAERALRFTAGSELERRALLQLARFAASYGLGPVDARFLLDPEPQLLRRVFEEYARELEGEGEAALARRVRWLAAWEPRRAVLWLLEMAYYWEEQGVPYGEASRWDLLLQRLIKAAAEELGQQRAQQG
jgi:hypothetical protein